MKSHEVLKSVVERAGAKQVAHDLGVSSSLVYKWCADPPSEPGAEGSGARNPLDRLISMVESTGDRRPIEWLCSRVGGYFVESPSEEDLHVDAEYVKNTQRLLARFSELLQVLSESIASEGRIDEGEAARIRAQWQRLQGRGEAFVQACESGVFDPTR